MLEHVPRVGDVDNQKVSTLVSNCVIRIGSSVVRIEVAVSTERARSGITNLLKAKGHILEHELQ